MESILEGFNSPFVVTEDLKGLATDVTITGVEFQPIGESEEPKLIVRTREFAKGFVMGVKNVRIIARLHGLKPADVIGKRITIYPSEWINDGVPTPCMKVRAKAPPEPAVDKSPARKGKRR